ncbi:MAG: hypothetical protein KF852_03185 [Saprospiraceae bacterium]|nr:hypothetical protein [Saprospiraceae bacterium]
MVRKILVGLLYLAICPFSACTKDTCNGEPTFRDMTVNTLDSTQTTLSVELQWGKGKDLPKAYFEQIHLITGSVGHDFSNWKNDFVRVNNTLIQTDTSLRIVLHRNLINIPRDTVDLHYQLPDRRGFVDCDHPGSNDSYFLDLQLLFSTETGRISASLLTWRETLQKGPI